MRVEIAKTIMGRDPSVGEFCYREGEIQDLPEALALKWLKTGHVKAVEVQPETATAKVREITSRKREKQA
jgi:hypothetical protein